MMLNIAKYQPITLDMLLYGDNNLSVDSNLEIVNAVREFMKRTHRFDHN